MKAAVRRKQTRLDMPNQNLQREYPKHPSSLPVGGTQDPAQPGSAVAPAAINTKMLMARSIALAHTGIVDKETREAEDGHQAMPGASRCVWSRRG